MKNNINNLNDMEDPINGCSCGCGGEGHKKHHDDECCEHHHEDNPIEACSCGCGGEKHHDDVGGIPGSCCSGGGSKHHDEDKPRIISKKNQDIIVLAVSAVSIVLSYFGVLSRPYWDFAFIAALLCGVPILISAFKSLTKGKITASLLVSVALIASLIVKEYFAAGEVALIMQLGGFLEDLTVASANKGIKSLLSLSPDYALIKTGNGEKLVPASEVKVGDIMIVKVGEGFAVDGEIIEGETAVNQSAITGESLPVEKKTGDAVFEGTINCSGVVLVRATATGEDSSVAKMARLVLEAGKHKAPIVKIADRLASYLVPSAIAAAVIIGLITRDLQRAVTIMVVFCPCSLVIATPAAIMASVAKASKLGIIIKSGGALESISKLDAIAFDKTGTITTGKLRVDDVYVIGDKAEFMALAASAESLSEHPISKAVTEYAEEYGLPKLPVTDFKALGGKGLTCVVDGKSVAIGNEVLMADVSAKLNFENEATALKAVGKRALFVAVDGEVSGVISVFDTIKKSSADAVKELGAEYGLQTVMLTGDSRQAADEIGRVVGISEVIAECLPEDKVAYVKAQTDAGKKLAMVGDGVNDAPALATATVGIAMGAFGSDIAVETADVAIMNDDLAGLPKLMNHTKKTMRTVKGNITFSMTLNVVAIVLASLGLINPVIGALIHNCGSVLVIMNSVLLLKRK